MPSGARIWRLRLMALVGVPVLLIGLLELTLRIVGFGYPTSFLLSQVYHGKQTFVQNNRFGWRFFGPQMSRLPAPIAIPKEKSPGTIRIFVFGESAAYGDPRPAFGLSRMLEAMLSLRYPGVQFEVVNAAMTAINSHSILPIARDCARAEGDIWVIYMGNNEVVGPFGAGTVFGSQVPPLRLIRSTLALKTLRLGQLMDSMGRWLHPPQQNKSEWGGMTMFLGQQVRSDDGRMRAVYRNFESNLADILRTGISQGCGIVLSTVAVNLRDCAPFASTHNPGLAESQLQQWKQSYQRGVEAQNTGLFDSAAESFAAAAKLDNSYAELRFRQGVCALQLKQDIEAQRQFTAARDLDALRFRCDAHLNELVRQAAAGARQQQVQLADAERVFAEQSPQGVPGENLFYEHVHLTFEGNYLLGRTIAPEIEALLSSRLGSNRVVGKSWPSISDCAQRLNWNPIDSRAAYAEMSVRVADAPFTAQINHRVMADHLAELSRPPGPKAGESERAEVLQRCENTSALYPNDPYLQASLASLRESSGNVEVAVKAMRRSLELLPTSLEAWAQLGLMLVQQQQFEDATAAFRNEFALDPEDVSALQNLATCFIKENKVAKGIREYRRALAIKPRFGPAWLGLGLALENSGDKAEALECFQKALTNRIHRGADLATLARFAAKRGWFEAAATNYVDAVKLSGPDARLNYEAGQVFGVLGRHREAAQYFATAAALAPSWAEAQFEWGLELGQSGQPAEATARFQEATRLKPDLLEARLNLAVALLNQHLYADALGQFEQVLQRSPTNAMALRYAEQLRKKVAPKAN